MVGLRRNRELNPMEVGKMKNRKQFEANMSIIDIEVEDIMSSEVY